MHVRTAVMTCHTLIINHKKTTLIGSYVLSLPYCITTASVPCREVLESHAASQDLHALGDPLASLPGGRFEPGSVSLPLLSAATVTCSALGLELNCPSRVSSGSKHRLVASQGPDVSVPQGLGVSVSQCPDVSVP